MAPMRPVSVNEVLVPDIDTYRNNVSVYTWCQTLYTLFVSITSYLFGNLSISTLKANVDDVKAPTVNGYKLVNPQELKVDHEEQQDKATLSRTGGDTESSKHKSSQHPVLLSPTQLVLHRGLTLLILVLILAIGVTVHVAFPVPEPTILSGTNGTLIQGYNSTSPPLTLTGFTLSP